MPDPNEPVTIPNQQPQVLSPSPVPGHELPQRRAEDTKSYSGEWTVLILAILGWATTFCLDMAAYETFDQILSPKFIGIHVSQLFTVTVAVITAKRMR